MVRPHVLKVDVEGHDYDVLMGFLGDNMLQTMLPLMINFEAKSISTKFDLLKQSMIDRYAFLNLYIIYIYIYQYIIILTFE